MIVLTLNSGSSSLKFGLYRVDGSAVGLLVTGEIERGELCARDTSGNALPVMPVSSMAAEATIAAVGLLLKTANLPHAQAIGHRVVHGGPHLLAHCRIDARVLGLLDEARALSPLHAPAALAMIDRAAGEWPDVPQFACFDTAFHAAMPAITRTLPVSKALRDAGVHRYGFHGLSCESILHQITGEMPPRLIIAHLGSGASITAVRKGRSVDTSMGLTPSGGVMMATRSGDLDPGTLIYLLREKGFDAGALEQLVDHRSGLFGVSGLSGDLRVLHDAGQSNTDAALAVEMFCLSVAKQIVAMMTTLGGADTIVFTGGIGEHDAAVRQRICNHLAWVGVSLSEGANQAGVGRISDASSRSALYLFPSEENLQIARHVFGCIVGPDAQPPHAP